MRKPKFSRELLDLRKIEVSLAKQGEYAEAQKVKEQADAMEATEMLRLSLESASAPDPRAPNPRPHVLRASRSAEPPRARPQLPAALAVLARNRGRASAAASDSAASAAAALPLRCR